MQTFSTLGSSRRQRQRQSMVRSLQWAAGAALIALAGFAAYQAGRAQNDAVVERLSSQAERLETQLRRARAEALAATEQAKVAVDRAHAIAERYRQDVPQDERAGLMALIDRRLADGLDPGRLRFLLEQAEALQECAEEVETRRFLVTTPVAVSRQNTVSFGDNRIVVTGQGTPDRDEEGRPVGWFDVAEPVSIRFLRLDGAVSLAEGVLPLTHRVVDGDQEWRFNVRAQADRGFVEVTGQTCAFP
ncbi:MAG: hypothetical protein AAFX81_15910 [Pseudomonadota bacterium]